jgi:uroporphyrinogen decarboxylase
MAEFYIEAGMDVIAMVDPLVSQISPKQFMLYLHEPYQYLFDAIRQQNVFSSFFVCGDATKSIEVMCKTGPDSIAVDENLNMVTTKEITDRYNITLGGNIPLTTKMLLGNQQDNMKYVVDFLDSVDHHNLILAPGCDMPYDTPIENVVGCLQAVRNPAQTKKMLENYMAPELDLESVQIPEYASLDKPLIEVFTLDSASCAACTYMLAAVQDAARDFGQQVNVVEYKFTLLENVARVVKMGVANLFSVYINGNLRYSSIIPDKQELVEEIRKVL